MMKSSQVIGADLLKMLGVPCEGCRKAVITLEADRAIRIDAEYITGSTDKDAAAAEIARYKLRAFEIKERKR